MGQKNSCGSIFLRFWGLKIIHGEYFNFWFICILSSENVAFTRANTIEVNKHLLGKEG